MPLLRQLVGGLGISTSASSGDLRLMIDRKLTEASRDAQHTQVVLREVEHGTHISLQDETGIFSEFAPPELESAPKVDSSEGKDDPIETGPQIVFFRAES